MTFTLKSRKLIWLVSLIGLTIILSAFPAQAQFYDLEVKVADTSGMPGDHNSAISIWMSNYTDVVAGFELLLQLQRPDIMYFQNELTDIVDTLYYICTEGTYPGSCTDSLDVTDSVILDPSWDNYEWIVVNEYQSYIGNHEVAGTLVENWEYVNSQSLDGTGHNLKIVAQANTIAPPYTPGISYPQDGTLPLIRLLADIYNIPDSATGDDRRCVIYIQADNLDNFSFSDEQGNGIGVITDTIIDTSFYDCMAWHSDTCVYWEEQIEGPADSTWCCDTFLSAHLDTSKVKVRSGTLTVLEGMCGDVNCNSLINLLDITYLIQNLYMGGPPPCNMWAADVNSSGNVNLLDITYLIDFLYTGGPAPNCQ